ncbi:hypothetical protein [Desulfovibrio sp.]|uniref:hypothetical protein n=1 Tax=Desulfovibrio sp. TaxID=885 RepID=UPI0025BCB4CD|nr:hypothetical protein [Desulfovibrio sp.]
MSVSSTQENTTQESITVDEAKRRLREAASGFDPYSLVRRRPLTCTGSAFLLGLGWHWAQPGRMTSGVMAFALQSMSKVVAGSLAARLKGAFSEASATGEAGGGTPGTAGPDSAAPVSPSSEDAAAPQV